MDLLENVGRRHQARGDLGNFVNVAGKSLNGYERKNMFRNCGGERFEDTGFIIGADRIEDGRSVASLDIENDGDLDLIIENYRQPARLLVNRGVPSTHWLELRLAGAGPANGGSNRSGLGARVVLSAGGRLQSRQVVSSGGYLTGVSHSLHFGLGTNTSVDWVRIYWPSGREQRLENLAIDRKHRIEEPTASPAAARAR